VDQVDSREELRYVAYHRQRVVMMVYIAVNWAYLVKPVVAVYFVMVER
jgi:hypothetical protein